MEHTRASQSVREVADILRGVCDIDKQFCEGDNQPHMFVAVNLRNVSGNPTRETNWRSDIDDILARLTKLEDDAKCSASHATLAASHATPTANRTYASATAAPAGTSQVQKRRANEQPRSPGHVRRVLRWTAASNVVSCHR